MCGWCRVKEATQANRERAHLSVLCSDCRQFLLGCPEKDLTILLLLEMREVVHGLNFIASRGTGFVPALRNPGPLESE
jgi:hypothetical protein